MTVGTGAVVKMVGCRRALRITAQAAVRATRVVALATALVSALPVLTFLTGPIDLHAQIRAVLVEDTRPGRPAPVVELPQATAAGVLPERYDLRKELGLVVVLGFCPSLADEECQGFWRGWQPHGEVFGGGVSVLGVTEDPAGRIPELATSVGLLGRFLSDEGAREARRWGVPPRQVGRGAVFLVTPEGRISYRDLQYDPLDSEARNRLLGAVAAVRMPAR